MVDRLLKDNILFLKSHDCIFRDDIYYPTSFSFDNNVAEVFDDMILRSVPLYLDVLENVVGFVNSFYQVGTKIFDIGCSTGSAMAAICKYIDIDNMYLVGIDNSKFMIDKAKLKLSSYMQKHRIELMYTDALDIKYQGASVIILNYTLQFISVRKRVQLLTNIYNGLINKGILYLSDKVLSNDMRVQEVINLMYENFKLKNGYFKKEIERKKQALDNVLVPLCIEDEINLIKSVGFKHVEIVMKWNNFVSFIALK